MYQPFYWWFAQNDRDAATVYCESYFLDNTIYLIVYVQVGPTGAVIGVIWRYLIHFLKYKTEHDATIKAYETLVQKILSRPFLVDILYTLLT